MKQSALFILLTCALSLSSCFSDEACENEWSQTVNVPITVVRQEIYNTIAFTEARDLCIEGEIFSNETYLFINEPNVGFHVIDNSNSAEPENVGFLNIPGSTRLFTLENQILVNCFSDLIALNFSGNDIEIVSSYPNILVGENSIPVDENHVISGYREESADLVLTCDGILVGNWQCEGCLSEFSTNESLTGIGNQLGFNTTGELNVPHFYQDNLYILGPTLVSSYSFRNNQIILKDKDILISSLASTVESKYLYKYDLNYFYIHDLSLEFTRQIGVVPINSVPPVVYGDYIIHMRQENPNVLENQELSVILANSGVLIYKENIPVKLTDMLIENKVLYLNLTNGIKAIALDTSQNQFQATNIQNLAGPQPLSLDLFKNNTDSYLIAKTQTGIINYRIMADGRLEAASQIGGNWCP